MNNPKIVLSNAKINERTVLNNLPDEERKEKIKKMMVDWFFSKGKGFISEAAEELGIEYEEAFELGKELIDKGYLLIEGS